MSVNEKIAITLTELNNKLANLNKEIAQTIPQVELFEKTYYALYYKYLLSSTASSAPMREAEARTRISQDHAEMYNDYLHKKSDLRVLLNQKEIFIEMSRNLRALQVNFRGGENA